MSGTEWGPVPTGRSAAGCVDRGLWICPASDVPGRDPDVYRYTLVARLFVWFARGYNSDHSPYGKDTGGGSNAYPGPGKVPGIYE